jgi:predicted DNA-binding protein (MmcQ/YjbR family)
MTLERFRQLCLAHPGVTEQIQWGADAVFKVGGKMFAVACTDPAYPNAKACSFKCDDEGFAELCERDGVGPAPYLARAKWVAMDEWNVLPDREVAVRLAAAYTIVRAGLTKKAQAELGALGAAAKRPVSKRVAKKSRSSSRRSSR